MRDEMANLAWAIERVIENALEQPKPRVERDADAAADAPPDQPTQAPPHYLFSSRVPSWRRMP